MRNTATNTGTRNETMTTIATLLSGPTATYATAITTLEGRCRDLTAHHNNLLETVTPSNKAATLVELQKADAEFDHSRNLIAELALMGY